MLNMNLIKKVNKENNLLIEKFSFKLYSGSIYI